MKSVRIGVLKFSPTWSKVCEKQPMSTSIGCTTLSVCIAKLLIDARSKKQEVALTARHVTESTLMSSLATSWPVIDLDNICIRIKRCSNVYSSPKKRTMMANASPDLEIPSKMTERYLPVISFQIRPSSSFKIKGTRSNM